MSRRILLPLAIGALLLGAVPALAESDPNGSSEVTTATRTCAEGGDDQYSAPGPNDCKDADGNPTTEGTYQAQYHSNEVTCGDSAAPAEPAGVHVYADGDPATQTGTFGVCSDGDLPVHGRAGAYGTPTDGTVVVDGDESNQPDQAKGYLMVKPSQQSVRCGKAHSEGGRADSDAPQQHDDQSQCG